MPPTIIFIRHAEAQHNATHKLTDLPQIRNFQLPDPELTEPGLAQCAELRRHLQGEEMTPSFETISPRVHELLNSAELVITSPLMRTCQTAVLALADLIEQRGIPILADARIQETSDKPCDTGSAITTHTKEMFPQIDFSVVEADEHYPRKTGPYAYSEEAITGRANDFLSSVKARKERVVVVVSHAGFLRVGLVHRSFMNADYRVFEFGEPGKGEGPFELVEWEETAGTVERSGENAGSRHVLEGTLSGGLKRSWAGYAPTDATVDFSE